MAEHSLLPPSSAARRMACPGSRALEALYPPDEPSKAAREGDAAHWVAAELLANRHHHVGKLCPNGEMITEDMLQGAEMYRQEIFRKLLSSVNIERRIEIKNVHSQCWGTPDCFGVNANTVYVFDYKFGHTPVEVFENWQLLEYAAGICHSGVTSDQCIEFISLTIIQPRAYHKNGSIRNWTISVDVLKHYIDLLKHSEKLAMQEGAPTKPSSECKNCKARHACPALQQSALSAVEIAHTNSPTLLNASSVGRELRLLKHAKKLLDARVTGLEEQALSYIRGGGNVPFFTLEPGRSSRVWKVPASDLATLQELLDIPLLKTESAITPTQAKAAGVPEEILKEYSEVKPGVMKLVEDEGKKAREVFGGK